MTSHAGATCGIPLRFRTGFIDAHGTPVELVPIQGSNCAFSFHRLCHFDESHTAWLTRVTVLDKRDGFHRSVCRKKFSQLLLRGRDIKVSDKNIGHELNLEDDLRKVGQLAGDLVQAYARPLRPSPTV
jgi:hypothetical protein